MRWTMPVLLASVLLSGCAWARPKAIPDQTIPHRLSRPLAAWLWVRLPDGTMTESPVTLPAGWWVASPAVIEPE